MQEELAQTRAEEQARQEAEKRAQREEEERARQEAGEQAEQARLAQERARMEFAEKARKAAEKEAREAEEKARREAERLARKVIEEAARNDREAAFTAQHQALGSTLITIGSGLDVRHIVSGFESCRVTIKKLPLNAKAYEVLELFTQRGINRNSVYVENISVVGNHQEAIVLTNQKQGAPIATALQGLRFRDATLCVDFAENATTEAMEKTSARNTNVLTITWFSPSSTMIAVYYNMETAQEKARVLDRKMLEGRRLKVEMNRAPAGVALRYYQPESVKIMNLPVGISTDRVQHFAGAYMVKQLKPAQYNLDDLLATLRRILAQADGLENFEHNHAEDGKITGKARFRFSDQAQTARDALDGKRLQHNFPVFKAFLPKALQYIISISPQQYNAQKRSWDSLRSNNKAAQVTFYENPIQKRCR